ncbi:hypothetical protein E4U57_002867 [Claviceps arundinis]|uniref:Uncharacterized protein n=1 Tax=Claviceps arundinis TaxID=1623583 RepID=A0ABQ7PLZ6_9HYPO|nr:hypothetical protein E4U57_002867 [Claviceps arundinis]
MVNDSRQGDGQREVLIWSSLSSSGSAETLLFEFRTPHVQQIDPKTSRVAVPAVLFASVSLQMGLYVAEEGFRGDTVLISEGLRPLLPRLELLKSRSQPHLQGHVQKMAPEGNETRAKASPKPHRWLAGVKSVPARILKVEGLLRFVPCSVEVAGDFRAETQYDLEYDLGRWW